MSVDAVERKLWFQVLEMGRYAMGMYLDLCGDVDMGETITLTNSRVLKRLSALHSKLYQSVFGSFLKPQVVYGTRKGQKIEYVKLDERLPFPESKFSYLVQDWDQSLAVENAYAKVNETIGKTLNFLQSVDSLKRINRKMSQHVGAF